MSIILADLDESIIDFMDLPDLVNLMLTNKNYYEKIKNKKLIIQWNELKLYDNNTIKKIVTSYDYHLLPFNENILDKLFLITCVNGYIEYATSLFIRYTINIHYDHEYAFQLCCKYGQINTAKWLIKLDGKINLHIDRDCAFQWSCKNGHHEIAKWLIELGENHGYGKFDQQLIDQLNKKLK